MIDTTARDAWKQHIYEEDGCPICVPAVRYGIGITCNLGEKLLEAAREELARYTELWSITATGPVWGEIRGHTVMSFHTREVCEAEGDYPCVLHKPSDHHMRAWPTVWRDDRALMERTCPHGTGHPDPDDLAFHVRRGNDWQGVHGCDGCCRKPPETATS